MNEKKCCGRCNYHRKVLCGLFSEWQCVNTDSPFKGKEREFHDTCELFDDHGPYIAEPLRK